jgi:DNA polymerase-3 subunit gamma/tau
MDQKENFIVSARKYRPATWEQVVGQDSITETLHNAISKNQLAHSYLFCGPRGVGKTTCARIFAKEINRSNELAEDEDFSFNIFELDAASNNSVDDIRYLNDQVRIPPQIGKYKVYIIDEVHMLSKAAFNAFLKTLEEPPKHAIFILATTEKHKIIPTILSRCQIYDFNRIGVDEIVKHLQEIAQKENISFEEEALHVVGQKADGALRDALSIFDQLSSFTNRNLTYDAVLKNLHVLDYDYFFKVTDSLYQADYAAALLILDDIIKQGFDGSHFLTGLASHLRDLLVCKHPSTLALLEVGENVKARYHEQANVIASDWVIDALKIANEAEAKYKSSLNQRLSLEVFLLHIASLGEKKKSELNEPKKTLREPNPSVNKPAAPKPTAGVRTAQPVPEPVKEMAPAQTNAPAIESAAAPTQVQEPAVVSTASKPHRTRKARTVSLNIDAEDQPTQSKKGEEEESETVDVSNSPKLPLPEAWKQLCESVLKDGNSNLNAMLSRQNVSDSTASGVMVILQHEIEEQEFNQHRTKVLTRLREYTGNISLSLSTKTETIESDAKLFSPKDKFQDLASKNSSLIKFKQDLDLELL